MAAEDDAELRRLEADAHLGRSREARRARAAELQAIAARAAEPGRRAQALMLLGATHLPTHPGPAAAAYREAAGAYWRAKDRSGESEALMCAADCVGGEERATLVHRALAMRRADGDRRGEAEILVRLGEAALANHAPGDAAARLEEAEALLADLDSPAALHALCVHLVRALVGQGVLEQCARRHEAADAYFARAEATSRRLEDRPGILAQVLDVRGELALAEARIADARTVFTASLPHHRAAKQTRGEAHALSNLAEAELHRGDLDAAADALRRARHLYVHLMSERGRATVLVGLGRIALEQGALRKAARRFAEARAVAPELTVALLYSAEVAARRGRPREAEALLAAVAEPEGLVARGELHQVRGELTAQRGDVEGARAEWAGAVASYREAGEPLGEAETLRREAELLARVRDPGATAIAEAAAALYDRLGCDVIARRLRA